MFILPQLTPIKNNVEALIEKKILVLVWHAPYDHDISVLW